jgi:hypothetical protein
MTRADILKLVGAAAGLAAVVALITPPTKPVPTAAGDWRKQLPVKTGTPAPGPSTVPVPAAALAPPPLPVRPATEEAAATDPTDHPPAPPPAYDRNDRPPSEDDIARRFRQGYHWAQRNGVDDERDCYRSQGDPFTDGCLAALREGDDDDDRPPRFGPFRRNGWDR